MKRLWRWILKLLSGFFFGEVPEPSDPEEVKGKEIRFIPPSRSDFGYTYKRVKKIGNYFAYGWIKHDKRII